MATYSQVPEPMEAKRWAALAVLDSGQIQNLIGANAVMLETLEGLETLAEFSESVRRENVFLAEHLQDRGLSPAGV